MILIAKRCGGDTPDTSRVLACALPHHASRSRRARRCSLLFREEAVTELQNLYIPAGALVFDGLAFGRLAAMMLAVASVIRAADPGEMWRYVACSVGAIVGVHMAVGATSMLASDPAESAVLQAAGLHAASAVLVLPCLFNAKVQVKASVLIAAIAISVAMVGCAGALLSTDPQMQLDQPEASSRVCARALWGAGSLSSMGSDGAAGFSSFFTGDSRAGASQASPNPRARAPLLARASPAPSDASPLADDVAAAVAAAVAGGRKLESLSAAVPFGPLKQHDIISFEVCGDKLGTPRCRQP